MTKKADNYTDPELRERIKQEIQKGDKGGKPGQWSARKSQLLAHEYEAQGGGYKGEKTESQKSLDQWTEEHWETKDGEKAVRDGETHRYLPKEAWNELSEEEKKATDRKKVEGSKRGAQFVANTEQAKAARANATGHPEHEA